MLNFAICDDNIVFLKTFSKILDSIFIENKIDANICYTSQSPENFLKDFNKNHIDVVFLDMNFKSKVNGCDIAKEIRNINKNVYIIFTTCHLEYALIAYKYKVFDYLPKPISKQRLEETIIRLLKDVSSYGSNELKTKNGFISLNKNLIINQNEINYIKRDKMKLVFCCSNYTFNYYGSLKKLKILLPDNFITSHKSYIVNINNISKIDNLKKQITFKNNDICFIGQKYKNNFIGGFK